MSCPGKNSWPELVGKNGEKAANIIEQENTNVDAIVIGEKDFVTTDFWCDRVFVRVNDNGVVSRVPSIG